jgi:uncharacterized protein (DUF433 family)
MSVAATPNNRQRILAASSTVRGGIFIAHGASARYALGTDLEAIMADVQAKRRTIVRVPGILSGEPIIEGTRIPVRAVVLYYYEYKTPEGVLTALPSLSVADVEMALRYYRAHRDEINTHIAENNEGEDIPYDKL